MNIKVVAAVLLDRFNNITVCKRAQNSKHFPGSYEFPGGKVEKGESKEMAIIRELKEELNIHVLLKDVHSFENNTKILNGLELTIFIIKKWQGRITTNANIHEQMMRVQFKELAKIHGLIKNDKEFIQEIQDHINNSIRMDFQ